MASLVGTLEGLLAALEIDRAHLAGHSLGGAIAIALALDRPDKVASLFDTGSNVALGHMLPISTLTRSVR